MNPFSIDLVTLAKAFATGAAVGAVFAGLSLPVPAPVVLDGVVGIAGVWLGYSVIRVWLRK